MTTTRRAEVAYTPDTSTFGRSRAVRVGNYVAVASTSPSWPDGSWNPDPEVQAARSLELIIEALKEVGAGPEDIVRTWIWLRHPGDAAATARAHNTILSKAQPAMTQLTVTGFLDPRCSVEIEAEAVIGDARERIGVTPAGWSRAVKVGDRVLVSCCAPIPAQAGATADPDPAAQAKRCTEVIGQALDQAGAGFKDVIATRVWVKDPNDGAAVTAVHHEAFGEAAPAFTELVVQYNRPDWRVEMEVEAYTGADRENLHHLQAADQPWSRGVRTGNRVVVATSAPREADGHTEPDASAQAKRCWEVVLGTLKAGGADPQHVVKARLYLRHPADAEAIAEATQAILGDAKPAISVIMIHGYLRPEWRVELEAEAIIP